MNYISRFLHIDLSWLSASLLVLTATSGKMPCTSIVFIQNMAVEEETRRSNHSSWTGVTTLSKERGAAPCWHLFLGMIWIHCDYQLDPLCADSGTQAEEEKPTWLSSSENEEFSFPQLWKHSGLPKSSLNVDPLKTFHWSSAKNAVESIRIDL